ncbi:MAG: L-seryl-tRNA(Sec) selenium transferase [Gemmatimonadota bacterium]|nr:L-seryl-tRNA(Sec) selenium transferase [Gemmatimonadota bacterium]
MNDPRRALPSIHVLLELDGVRTLAEQVPRQVVAEAVRAAVAAARERPADAPSTDAEWSADITARLAARERPTLQPVLNATGVVLHTNLGRAPLAAAAINAIADTARGFSSLEYDMGAGARGSRHVHCAALLCELTGAEDALVVNNCAAALVLALNTLADGRDAIVSRGELVEIGGSFRVPDIMAKSGARLVEVGTTNRTHAEDYRRAISAQTGALVRVHRSNFTLDGFVAAVSPRDLAAIADAAKVPLLHDFGSGLMLDLSPWGLAGEPTARDAVADGASLVVMSGDKLLGGPQAGIILGRAAHVDALRRNPLARALRVDKLTLAALHATLRLYREPARALREIPALAMLTASAEWVRQRAAAVQAALAVHGVPARVVSTAATVGGGAFPSSRIPSWAVALDEQPAVVDQRLRDGERPVVGRIADGALLLDLRAVAPDDDRALTDALAAAVAGGSMPRGAVARGASEDGQEAPNDR